MQNQSIKTKRCLHTQILNYLCQNREKNKQTVQYFMQT